jgi:hypothetical protein
MEIPPAMDRRRFKRYYTLRPCWCEGEAVTMYLFISNMSKGGFFLRTSNPLPIGRHAILTFRPIPSSEIIARVEVVWHSRGPLMESRTTISGLGTKLVDVMKGDNYFDLVLQQYSKTG